MIFFDSDELKELCAFLHTALDGGTITEYVKTNCVTFKQRKDFYAALDRVEREYEKEREQATRNDVL